MFSQGRLALLLASVFLLLLPIWPGNPASAVAQSGCTFSSGFQALHDQLAEVGDCLDNEQRNPATGNVEQPTRGGLLSWRPADNLVSFSNGQTTWLVGPDGLVSRPNEGPPFPWETVSVPIATPTVAPASQPPAAAPSATVDVRALALTETDLPSGFVRNARASTEEEPSPGVARAVAVFERSPMEAILTVVERYPDPATAAAGLRLWHPAAFPAITLGLMARRDQDWEEVAAPSVGELNRAFRVRQPAILVLPDGSMGSAAVAWQWAQRGSFVYGVGMHASQAQAALDGVGPLVRLIDGRVQQRLSLTNSQVG